ncbi:unnamed protein product [Cyprideis torosa]|uniref:Uncharacterized protein n=1 Tax=Cyprideis torosa TaxID=163714 RepID=A0A7R8WB23_9CRUS|nr:unnamed protein product [Cyprideis torosa]CAG0890330.1 unnamed protein product [Cyprideis torosa]
MKPGASDQAEHRLLSSEMIEELENEEKHSLSSDALEQITAQVTLPQGFRVKIMGSKPASGLWGIKHTRDPVDKLVREAKQNQTKGLPIAVLEVDRDGIKIRDALGADGKGNGPGKVLRSIPIESISYGVQDIVYTRVFSIILVTSTNFRPEEHPFRCIAYACETKQVARMLTFALATAFQVCSTQGAFSEEAKRTGRKPKRFAIDLRSPEELQVDEETEA